MRVRRDVHWLLLLCALAVAVRVAAVFAVASYRLERVTYEHGEIAANLLAGRGFSVQWMGADGPTSQQAPAYPVLLACSYWIFGVQTPQALLAMQLFQSLLGGVTCVLVVLLARELFAKSPPGGAAAAWFAGCGAACYPVLVYAVTQIQVASLAAMLGTLVLWCGLRAANRQSCIAACGCGIAAGLLILTDPILGLIGLVAGLVQCMAAIENRGRWIGRSMPPACTLVASLMVVAPWTIRNYFVHGEFVPVKSTFGYAFWQGNHEKSFGTDKVPLVEMASDARPLASVHELEQTLWQTRHAGVAYIDDVVLPRERVVELGKYTEPQRSRQLFRESLMYLRDHPTHYIKLCAQRLRFFLLFDETNPKSRVLPYRVAHAGLLFLSVLGLVVSRSNWRLLWPTYLTVGLITAFHALTITSARFHIPLQPIHLIWCGAAMDGVLRGVRTMLEAVRVKEHPALT